ncbi:hypothetical protein B0T19DRAFT_99489 [Cercophora scortea]|uniref:Uncharacterized protein n=1 Tax=Cercophora scortea TaxID=314031 RepID=A0AAE0IWD8_9PEZI|nr:hypothetical protein B0T19DRAFT_99489 [Cercophora scortea]
MMTEHQWPEAHRKRVREEDYCDVSNGGTLGFTEHRSKRLQALPLRTSQASRRWADAPNFPPSHQPFAVSNAPPRTITPGASDSEDSAQMELQTWASEPELVSHQPSVPVMAMAPDQADQDMDMMEDMMDFSEPMPPHDQSNGQGQQQQQNQYLGPGQFQPDSSASNITGRMPTPIHCSFAAQVRGNNWSGAAGGAMPISLFGSTHEDPNSLAAFSRSIANTCHDPSVMGHESIPRSLDGAAATAQVMADWSMVQNRRLPSPISESGGEDGNSNGNGGGGSNSFESPQMVLDSTFQPVNRLDHLTHQHPLITNLPSRPSSALDRSSTSPRQGGESSPGGCSLHNTMDVETTSPSTPSPKKGHTRSKHTVNSWTALQPGMKRSFSIGFRADCEKCRMKVPGHFNHIIIS